MKLKAGMSFVEQVKYLKKQLGESFKGFEFKKTFSVTSFKGAEIDDEQLAKINSYALVELKQEDVFARKMLLAHNAIDRDNERFPEDLLEDYAKTLPGKSALFGHRRPDPGEGLFFDAYTETMSPEEFKELTGEKATLPEEVTEVKVLWSWFYMMTIEENKKTIANIDGGIYRHVSIGFRAADIISVKKDQNGPVLYWEYVGPGEALEGSLVWLGAQNGATIQKSVLINEELEKKLKELDDKKSQTDDSITNKSIKHKSAKEKEDIEKMNELLKKLSAMCGKAVTEETASEAVKAVLAGKDTEIETLKTEKSDLETKNTDLKSLAEDGKAYRDELVSTYVTSKAKLGEVKETPEDQEVLKTVVETYPVAFLKSEVAHLEERVAKEFPEAGLKSGEIDDTRDDGKEKKNPLVPETKETK